MHPHERKRTTKNQATKKQREKNNYGKLLAKRKKQAVLLRILSENILSVLNNPNDPEANARLYHLLIELRNRVYGALNNSEKASKFGADDVLNKTTKLLDSLNLPGSITPRAAQFLEQHAEARYNAGQEMLKELCYYPENERNGVIRAAQAETSLFTMCGMLQERCTKKEIEATQVPTFWQRAQDVVRNLIPSTEQTFRK